MCVHMCAPTVCLEECSRFMRRTESLMLRWAELSEHSLPVLLERSSDMPAGDASGKMTSSSFSPII